MLLIGSAAACYDKARVNVGFRIMAKEHSGGVILGDRPLTHHDIVAIARGRAKVSLSAAALQRLTQARAVVDRLAAGAAPIYGLNTGLGAGVDTRLAGEEMSAFQRRV